jgi:aspartyl-tRNA synthetase
VVDKARSFFDKLNDWARGEGAAGLGYVLFEGTEGKGPIAKFIPEAAQAALKTLVGAGDGDAVFFVCDAVDAAVKMAGKARQKICDDMGNREQGVFKFCWITEFPFYSCEDGKIDFEHNPFSMPQGGLDALNNQDPLTIRAQQYDCVCNGYEIASGGIRNHSPEVMVKAFEIAGYDKEELEKRFGGMLNAMRFGAPPHGGLAYGVDRIIMLLANEPNLREVYAFVMNGAYEDQMMNAPNEPPEETLKSLHVRVVKPVAKAAA